jgi:hypothetical protein
LLYPFGEVSERNFGIGYFKEAFMPKLVAFLGVVGSTLVLGLLTLPVSNLVLLLFAFGITSLPPEVIQTMELILGVLLVFARLGAVEIEVNFLQLFL